MHLWRTGRGVCVGLEVPESVEIRLEFWLYIPTPNPPSNQPPPPPPPLLLPPPPLSHASKGKL